MFDIKNQKYSIFKLLCAIAIILILCFVAFYAYGCARSRLPSERKGFYDSLIDMQYPPDEGDLENRRQYIAAIANGTEDPGLRYHYEIEGNYYYILKDSIYTKEGLKAADLQPKSEGYFIFENNLYYVYGKERPWGEFTLGGAVEYTLKGYKYRKFDLAAYKDISIKKDEYEKLYYELQHK